MSNLTFHPSIDDPVFLQAYLQRVCQQYEAHKQRVLMLSTTEAVTGATNVIPPRIGRGLFPAAAASTAIVAGEKSGGDDHPISGAGEDKHKMAVTSAPPVTTKTSSSRVKTEEATGFSSPSAKHAPSKMATGASPPSRKRKGSLRPMEQQQKRCAQQSQKKKSPTRKQQRPAAKETEAGSQNQAGERKKRKRVSAALLPVSSVTGAGGSGGAGLAVPKLSNVGLTAFARASLIRAKQIDTQAPDPELYAPPNETEDERRRRLERINGRRKRAKKLIEIDQLNEQVVELSDENLSLIHI